MSKKIALAITLISIMFASTFIGIPVAALDFTGALAPNERQMAIPGTLYDEMFPEWNYTNWEMNSLTVGFTEYGETVTDQDPMDAGSEYGVGLTYPSVPEDRFNEGGNADVDMGQDRYWESFDDDGDSVVYVAEHIACPTISGGPSPGGLIYIPIEGWQLFWKWQEGTTGAAIDPSWHISMAIYGNHSAPYGTRARLDVKLASELEYEAQGMKVITDTSRLFAVKTHFYTYNETLLTELALDPVVFEIELIYVFFKATKKLVQFWTVQYLRSEYGAVDVVFRRLTDWSVDNKFQEYENENYACFFPTQKNMSTPNAVGMHALGTGCDYWPQNYSLGLAWTNSSIDHWDPEDAPHHCGFIAYYPNCSNWDTDNWNWYLTNMWTQWKKDQPFTTDSYQFLDPDRPSVEDLALQAAGSSIELEAPLPAFDDDAGPLTTRYSGQPVTYETQVQADGTVAGSPLMLGQWNFTLTSATANRLAKFVNVMGVIEVDEHFGYTWNPQIPNIGGGFGGGNGGSPGNHYSGDWNSDADLSGGRELSQIKYYLAEVFNSTYKLSSRSMDINGEFMDVSNWYPFAGVQWDSLEYVWNNTWIKKDIGTESGAGPREDASPLNCTFIYGDSDDHNGMVFTAYGSHVVDVVGGTEVGMNFGSYISSNSTAAVNDPWFEAMWDTVDFMGESLGPFVPEVAAPDFFWEKTMETYLDPIPDYSPVGPISTDLTLTAMRRMSARNAACCWRGDRYVDYFTTPTGCGWNLTHVVGVGGPKVNLATEYFNEHTWAVWTSSESGCEFTELADGGIYVFPSGNHYTGDGTSVITIVEDLNLSSWTAIYDEECLGAWNTGGCNPAYNTDGNVGGTITDGPTIVEPWAGLLIYGISGWDTRAAANWFAQYRANFNDISTMLQALQPVDVGYDKLGATTIILNTDEIADCCDDGWLNGVQEILGPCAGRWRLSTSAWNTWVQQPVAIVW